MADKQHVVDQIRAIEQDLARALEAADAAGQWLIAALIGDAHAAAVNRLKELGHRPGD
jgi:hypothetical protein